MNKSPVLIAFLLFGAGCILPDSVNTGSFKQPNLFANWEDPETAHIPSQDYSGGQYPHLPFQTNDLDIMWGAGNYVLQSLSYRPEGDWHQGFHMSGYQAQGLLENPANEEALFSDFISLVTDLSEEERGEYAAQFFAEEATFVETGNLPPQLHIEKSWPGASTITSKEIGYVTIETGPWKYEFSLATKREDRGLDETLHVDAAGFANYHWYTEGERSDSDSLRQLEAFLRKEGLTLQAQVEWYHGEREVD